MMRFTLTAAIVALTNAGHDSWGCWPEGGWTADEAGEAGLPSNFCVVGGDGQPIAKGLPGFSSGGVVGVVVLGAAGADGKPKLACVTSKAAYPELTVDIMAMGPTFQYCNMIDFSTMTAFWTRGKTDGAWNGPDMETPVGATSIYGAMAGESPMAACNRLGMETWMAAPGYMGQLTDYSGDTITATKLASQFVTECPRPGGPTCPEGTKEAGTCSDAVEIRGGTLAGAQAFIAENPYLGAQAAAEFGMEYCCTEEHHTRRLLFGSQPHHCASYDCAHTDMNAGR